MILGAKEIFTQLSDLLTNHWGEILAIITSPVLLGFLLSFFIKLILGKVESKMKNKYNLQILDQFKAYTNKLDETLESIKQSNADAMATYKEQLKEEMQNALNSARKTKQQVVDIIMNDNECSKYAEVIKEYKDKISSLENQIEELNKEKIIDEIKEDIEKVEEVPVIEVAKTGVKVAKRVING